SAQVPYKIPFQGVLTDDSGVVLPDDTYTVKLSLWNAASNGTLIWDETKPITTVNGRFDTLIGTHDLLNFVGFSSPLWLGITVDPDHEDEMTPRVQLGAAPYALGLREAEYSTSPKKWTFNTEALIKDRFVVNIPTKGDVLYVSSNINGVEVHSNQYVSGRLGVGATTPPGKVQFVPPGNINSGSGIVHANAGLLIGSEGNGIVFDANQIERDGGALYLNFTVANDVSLVNGGGNVGIGEDVPVARLHVVDDINSGGDVVTNYVTLIDNVSTGTSADVLALRVGNSNPGAAANFIGFFDGGGLIGQVEANSGSVTYNTSGADYGEYLPLAPGVDHVAAGQIVGITAGEASLQTRGAERIMVITGRPSVLGNMPSDEPRDRFATVAFVGQVPVQVDGPVAVGDYVVDSGRSDGSGIAIAPRDLSVSQLGRIAGRVWKVSDEPGGKREVILEVGLDLGPAVSAILTRHEREIKRLSQQLESLENNRSASETL
ncbi:MAG: hypothetical protein WBW88_16390, partial [Rhodothermales bacterium]